MKLNLEEKNVKWGLTAFLVILCGILIFLLYIDSLLCRN